jgi:allene oxide cyclase
MPKSISLLSMRLLLAAGTVAAAIVTGPAGAEPRELKITEHATTDAVTDTGASGDSAGDILTFANEVFEPRTRPRLATTRASASAPW